MDTFSTHGPFGDEFPHGLSQADINEYLLQAGVLPLRRDIVTLLTYVNETKVVGTTSTGNMPLKSIREVTARFVKPPTLDTEIGGHVYRLRSEERVWPLYFLHILAEVGGLLTTPKAKRWQLNKVGHHFLNLNAMLQVVYLINTWWYQVNWLVAYPFEGMGDELPRNFNMVTLLHLDVLPVEEPVEFDAFADKLIDAANLYWHAQSQDSATLLLRGSIKRMVIKILKKFGAVEIEYREESRETFAAREPVTFKITKFGKELLESVKLMGFV